MTCPPDFLPGLRVISGNVTDTTPPIDIAVTIMINLIDQAIYEYIRECQLRNHEPFPPTIRELCSHMNLSISATYDRLNKLVRLGLLHRIEGKPGGFFIYRSDLATHYRQRLLEIGAKYEK